MSAEQVRTILGAPDLLDTPTHRVYEWSTDRRLVLAGAAPVGVPVAGVFGGQRFRALVRFDAEGRAERVEVGSLPTTAGESGARLEACYRLESVPGLADVRLAFETGGTAGLSLDGQLLAVTDRENRLWVIDVAARRGQLVHTGKRAGAFALLPPGPVRSSFSPAADRLAVAQRRGPALVFERDAAGSFGSPRSVGADELLAVAFANSGAALFLDDDGALWPWGPEGPGPTSAVRAELALGRRGPVVERPAPAAELLGARVDGPGLQPDQLLVLAAGGRGLAVIDPRRAATGWGPPGLCVSPCGRWLAHNSGRHVELWRCADLAAALSGAATGALVPEAVFVMAQAHLDEDWLEAAAALAFDGDSRLLAAATATSIHVWRLADGASLAAIGPLPIELDRRDALGSDPTRSALRVHRLALAPDGRLTALLHDYRDTAFLACWRLEDGADRPR